jgi:hypothetical protein
MTAPKMHPVQLSDKLHNLRFTNFALLRLEQEAGMAIKPLMESMATGSMLATVGLIWAGLLHEEPRLTLERCAERIDMGNREQLAGIGIALSKALEDVFGRQDEPAPSAPEGNAPAAS